MKKIFMLSMILSMVLISCTPCDIAKTGTNLIAKKIAVRWGCDQTKLYEFMIQPLSNSICKEESGEKSTLDYICPIATGFIVDLGEAEIVSRFDCDPVKVRADLSGANKLCDLIGEKEVAVEPVAI